MSQKSAVKWLYTEIAKIIPIYGLNLPEQFILALAFVDGKQVQVHYVQNAFRFEPDFGVTSINFNVKDLLTKTVHRRTITLE